MAELVKSLNGLAWGSVKSRNGLARASIKSYNGVDTTPAGGGPVLANLEQWTRIESLALSDNDPISTVTDLSGNGNDGTETGSNRATFKSSILNGKAVARCNGSNFYLMPTISVGTDFCIMAVVNLTGDSALFGGSISFPQIRWGSSTTISYFDDPANNASSSTLATGYNTPAIVALNCVGGTLTFYQNGTSYGTGTWAAGTFTCMMSLVNGAAVRLQGDWAESLFYTAGLSGGDLTANFDYLNGEYAIY